MLERLPRPLILAHRGASAHAPENTLAAFKLAYEQGVPAVELDAKLTADGEVIVIHDATVDRTTNGTGRVQDFSLSQIQKLDAGSWYNPRFAGERVPTLRDVFDLLKDKVWINIELTNYADPGDCLVEKVVGLIQEFDISGQILFSSFLIENILKVKSLMPEVPCGMLALHGLVWRVMAAGNHTVYNSLNPDIRDITPELVNAIHQQGKVIYPYTVVDPVDMRRLIDMGVDGMFVNDPLAGLAATGGMA